MPPPAFYLANDLFVYSAELSAGKGLSLGGAVVADVKANAVLNFFTPTWVTPIEVFGGNLGFAVSIPFGTPRVQAGALVEAPRVGRALAFRADQNVFDIGDPVVSSFVGWHSGNFHWQVGGSVSIPSGSYRPGELSNVSFNRYIGDVFGAISYIDPTLGLDVSGAIGYEINGKNPSTDYISGNAFHADFSISKSLTKEFSVGFLAGHYEQVSGDKGSALLGAYKGRTTAVGGTVAYNFEVAGTPVSARLKVLREIDVRNRPEGTITIFTVSLPLGGHGRPPPPQAIASRY